MKTTNFSRTFIPGGWLCAFLSLVLATPVFAQVLPSSLFSTLGPVVRITSPANHATFFTPVDLPIFAFAHDGVDALAVYDSVEFYASNSLGTKIDLGAGVRLSAAPPVFEPYAWLGLAGGARLGAVYCVVWTNVPAGSYVLTAVSGGRETNGTILKPEINTLSRTSAPVNITVLVSATNTNPTDVVGILASDPVAVSGTNACWIWPGMTNATPSWTNWPPKQWGAFTNWGPKNGLFTVRRFGDASSNLTVNYTVSGTAVSNMDFVGLPGSVTIPAGDAYALIPVVPLDNSASNYSGTVIVSLNPATNADYTLGYPRRAAVVIRDYWPRPLPWLLADRSFHFNTNGPDGAWFYLQHSGDLLNWTTDCTNQVVHGSIDYVDPDAPSNSIRFYRYLPLTNGPAD